jgi:phospholipase/carboxylesterase
MVQSVIDEEVAALGGDPSKVFIGGFSQGCAMAIHNGLIYKGGLLGGIIGMSGYLFPQTKLPEISPPTHLSHGEHDPVININYAIESYQRENFLTRQNLQFTKQPMLEHSVDLQTLSMARKFIGKILKIKK